MLSQVVAPSLGPMAENKLEKFKKEREMEVVPSLGPVAPNMLVNLKMIGEQAKVPKLGLMVENMLVDLKKINATVMENTLMQMGQLKKEFGTMGPVLNWLILEIKKNSNQLLYV